MNKLGKQRNYLSPNNGKQSSFKRFILVVSISAYSLVAGALRQRTIMSGTAQKVIVNGMEIYPETSALRCKNWLLEARPLLVKQASQLLFLANSIQTKYRYQLLLVL